MISRLISLLVLLAAFAFPALAASAPPPIEIEVVVPLDLEGAWAQWTTPEGIESFFARGAVIEPEVLGEYSIHFFPDNPPGQRGAEGMRILAYEPGDLFSFTWNAPPNLPLARAHLAVIEITFDQVSENETLVRFRHDHFGRHGDAGAAREYFNLAWAKILSRSVYAAEHGPIDWDNPPDGLMFRSPTREELDALAAQHEMN